MRKSIILGIIISALLIVSSCKKNSNCHISAAWTYTISGDSVYLHSTDTSSANNHNWTFPGSTSTTNAISLSHVFSGAGTYNVCLDVSTPGTTCSNSVCQNITIGPRLIFKFVFDSTQVRLNNFGQPDTMPAGHAAQSPHMNVMSGHYIELAQNANTALGTGAVLYMTPTTTAGGASAIDFSKEVLTPNNGTFYSVSLDSVTPGTYQYLRVSLAYQNYGVNLYYDTTFTYQGFPVTIDTFFPCTIASFVGVNTYITTYLVNTEQITVNGNKLQGYWGFESKGTYNYNYASVNYPYPYNWLESGQAPAGATTVVNPLFATSPIPAGSCVATGQFQTSGGSQLTSLTIPPHGTATSDIVITVSLSVNHSFEWVEVIPDGNWEPTKGENIVNMGIRGLIPYVN